METIEVRTLRAVLGRSCAAVVTSYLNTHAKELVERPGTLKYIKGQDLFQIPAGQYSKDVTVPCNT